MAIDEINSTTPVLPTVVPNRERNPAPAPVVTTPPNTVSAPVVPATLAASQGLTPAQQAALLVNGTLQGLNFVSPVLDDALLFNESNPIVSAVAETQGLTPAQLAALLVNKTLQGLNVAPGSVADALLINETNPTLAVALETQELTLAQQAALRVNETLQDLGAPLVAPANVTAAGQTGEGAPIPGPLTTTLLNAIATGAVTGAGVPGGLPSLATAATPSTLTTPSPEVPAASAELPVQPTAVQPILDRNPIAVPVYEIRDPAPAPAAPKPTRKDLSPALPIGRVRPVDRLVLRQEWEKRKEERGRQAELPLSPSLTERSIQQMVNQANEDLAANGLPLRLVLVKNDEGYSLDIYDCSGADICRLSQEVPLDLNHLLTTLDNIQHETGIIVNIKT